MNIFFKFDEILTGTYTAYISFYYYVIRFSWSKYFPHSKTQYLALLLYESKTAFSNRHGLFREKLHRVRPPEPGKCYVPKNWAFASTLCKPSICGQLLWTIWTNCCGLTSFCISAGLGKRNFVSFNVGGWTMSAARCKRAASRHTSNCK